MLQLDLTSNPEEIAGARKAVEAFAHSVGMGASAADLGLIVTEALANVINHAYHGQPGKPISLSASHDGSRLTIAIRDWGDGVNPDELPRRQRDPWRPGGLGLLCMRRLADSAVFASQPDGMLLTISKTMPQQAEHR